jgi:glycosyltransferase involved in cell wall biosynthesis
MKISIIIPAFYPATVYGGPIFSSLHASTEISKLDAEVFVSTTNANMNKKLDVKTNQWIKFSNNLYVKYYNTSFTHTISIPMFIFSYFDIKKSDVIHIQSVFNISTVFALMYCKFLNKPLILSPRGQFGGWCLDNGSKLKNLFLKYLIKPLVSNTMWHATAQQEKDEILSVFSNAEVEIIPNGIEYDKFQISNTLTKNQYMKKFTSQKMEPNKIIISMGRIQKKKGFDILINSFNITLKVFPNSVLLIAGGDEGEEQNLKKQIKNLNLEKNVFLIGPISGQDKIDFLANADLFCLPSHNENFGNVYVESLATGTPIVASRMTPWSEVENFDCGKWVENSIEETSKAINEILIKDRENMRINSKNLAHKYDWKNVALNFKNLFEKILEKKYEQYK